LYFGNKITWGKDNRRYYVELQARFENNFSRLERWYIEAGYSLLPSERWEIVPDFRFSVMEDDTEIRPGIGALAKFYPGERVQIVQQIKYQADFLPKAERVDHAVRAVTFVNYLTENKKWVLFGIAGFFYQNKPKLDFSEISFIRYGAGVAYIFDVKHSINLFYFNGIERSADPTLYVGVIATTLIININKEYKYVPAKFYNF